MISLCDHRANQQANRPGEAVLKGAPEAFDASLALRRIGGDVGDAELFQSAAELSGPAFAGELFFDRPAVAVADEDAVVIAVEAKRDAGASRQAEAAAEIATSVFGGRKLGGRYLAGGVVDKCEQGELGAAIFQPAMRAAIEQKHVAFAGTREAAKSLAADGEAFDFFGAVFNAALIRIGDKLGLYKALAQGGPQTPAELAKRTGTTERYVREWLSNQAAGGYVTYDAPNGKFHLSEEQTFAMADESSPVFLPGAFQLALAAARAEEQLTERFRTGAGMGWHEHHHELFVGTERFFRPGYAAHLVSAWIPSLEGVEAKLKSGARVADVGCGLGASTILMAKSYPKSEFAGFDYHDKSIDTARQRARDAGVGDRVKFEVAMAKAYPGKDYDFVTFFDCLHDMGDPAGASAHVRSTLKKDGTWMIVEPAAGDKLEDNLNPIGRAFYGASTLLCTPASLSQEVGLALGAQAGEKRMREVVTSGGFTHFRRAAQTPFNLIFEARP